MSDENNQESGLEAKNKELLAEVKKLKADLRKVTEINPDDLAKVEQERDEALAQVQKLTGDYKKLSTDFEATKKALESESGFTSKLLVDNGLNDALVKANVKPEYMRAVKAMLKEQVQLVAEGDNRLAKVGEKALSDFITDWTASDEGKHYVAAPSNSGGGAHGGGKAPATKQITRAELDAMPVTKHAEFFKSGGIVSN